jgi:hypothetical protein
MTLEEEGVQTHIGDQADKPLPRSLAKSSPAIGILIDDGGHTMQQQISTIEVLFPTMSPQGIHVYEDLHT